MKVSLSPSPDQVNVDHVRTLDFQAERKKVASA
jgi:hypothetical protein